MQLRTVNLMLTARCNLKCPFCYQARRNDDLSTSHVLALVDEIAGLGVQLLMLPGGEPLLRADLEEIVGRAHEHGMQSYIATNAVLMDPARGAALVEAGLTGACVGMEVFDPASRDEGGGPSPAALRGLGHLLDTELDVYANFVVTHQNLRLLPAAVKYLVGLGLRQFTLLRPMPSHEPSWFERARLQPKDIFRLQIVKTRLEARFDVEFNLDCALGALQFGLPLELLEEEEVHPCSAGRDYISIDSNGDVYPCAHLKVPEFYLGNAAVQPLSELLATDEVLRPFSEEPLKGHCGSCSMRAHCGGCRVLAYHDHGDAWAQDDDCPWGSASTLSKVGMGTRFWGAMLERFGRVLLRR